MYMYYGHYFTKSHSKSKTKQATTLVVVVVVVVVVAVVVVVVIVVVVVGNKVHSLNFSRRSRRPKLRNLLRFLDLKLYFCGRQIFLLIYVTREKKSHLKHRKIPYHTNDSLTRFLVKALLGTRCRLFWRSLNSPLLYGKCFYANAKIVFFTPTGF